MIYQKLKNRYSSFEQYNLHIILYNLLIIGTISFLIFSGCTITPLYRDEIEAYEAGVTYWENGQYEAAIQQLSPFMKKDSLYVPLFTIIADSYYRLERHEDVLTVLTQAVSIKDSGIKDNLYMSLQAQIKLDNYQQEKVSFTQYINDIANHFALDKALLVAMIEQASSFYLETEKSKGRLGIMGLTSDQAKRIGLHVPESNNTEDLLPLQNDDRLDPAKSIYKSVQYFSKLINKYRFGSKSTNLIEALSSFMKSDNDSLIVSEIYLSQIIDYYRIYGYDPNLKQQAMSKFYLNNNKDNKSFETSILYLPHQNNDQLINNYKDDRLLIPLYLTDYNHQAYYYNNMAIICEQTENYETAKVKFKKAHNMLPNNDTIIINKALFYFNREYYHKAYTLSDLISLESDLYETALIIKGYTLLFLEEIDLMGEMLTTNTIKYSPHLINLKGLFYFHQDDLDKATKWFEKAFVISAEPIFAANFLAASLQKRYPETSYAELTKFNRIIRNHDTGYTWPVDLRNITSDYGWRPNPFARDWKQRLKNLDFHNGIDIPGQIGLPVRAAADGIVTISNRFPLGGETIFIKHPDNYITTYLHLDKRFVHENELVRQGQIIGLLGNTGQTTGPHLHFGMFNDNSLPANPKNYLPAY